MEEQIARNKVVHSVHTWAATPTTIFNIGQNISNEDRLHILRNFHKKILQLTRGWTYLFVNNFVAIHMKTPDKLSEPLLDQIDTNSQNKVGQANGEIKKVWSTKQGIIETNMSIK